MNKLICLIFTLLLFSNCKNKKDTNSNIEPSTNPTEKKDHQINNVKKATDSIIIDGFINEDTWNNSSWLVMDQVWLGEPYDSEDFNGKYKLSWTDEALYVLVEIQDDILLDQNPDPLKLWWDDDCVEIFIDEDNSGGEHQYNHNAFAYHIALDGNVVDMAPGETPKLYNSHVQSKRQTTGNTSVWEFKISLYSDTYKDDGDNTSIQLNTNKKIGFAIAYCDNDNSVQRENFIGSVKVEGEDKNRGWIDANIFGTLVLID